MTCFQSSPLRLLFAVAIVGILPPALTRAEDEKLVKVFILAGQSNMQGHSPISNAPKPGQEAQDVAVTADS